MKLYIAELPAPRLYLTVPEACPLILKSAPPAPTLYLEKAKYTKREGSPGNYRYTYDKDSGGGGKTVIPEQQLGFEFNENASTQQIVDELNKMSKDKMDWDFYSLSLALEKKGIKANSTEIGEAFDTGKVQKPDKPHITNMSAADLKDHVAFEIGNPNSPTGRAPIQDDSRTGAGEYDMQIYATADNIKHSKELANELGMEFEYDMDADKVYITEDPMRIYDVGVASQKSFDPLYLDLSKAGNPNREPAMGQFIGGGKGKAHGEGQESLEDQMKDLMNTLPGDDVEKAKYTSRTGSPGNYQYHYGDGGDSTKKDDAEESNTKNALRSVAEYFKPLTQASSYKQVPGEIADAARAAGRYFTGKSEGGQQS